MSSANSELYEPVFKLSGISKSFDGRPLLKNINLDFYPGQICSILGENGAGKSTLIKIMAGILQPDEGDIFIQGNRVRLKSPHLAKRTGVHFVLQAVSYTHLAGGPFGYAGACANDGPVAPGRL